MQEYKRIVMLIKVWVICLHECHVSADCPRNVDPCLNSVYTELDEPTRSILYNATDSAIEGDFSLPQTWYRPVSGAGYDMPTEIVYTGQCQAAAPIYLTDSLPSQADGIVDLEACASFLDDTCTRIYTIPAKNCGGYTVYCLSPTQDAFDRYCMGSELECPDGYTSYNRFTPGCEEIDGTIGDCPTDSDPCLSSIYVELNEPTRSTLYNFTTSSENDFTLGEEWYRSISGAGGDMSTEVVNTAQCNALAPIYLTDRLPLEWEGIVTAKGCASFLDDTCIRQYYIQIKNCGDYNVYCLPASADPHDRYCFGSEIECAVGYTSYNGFTPGCEEIDGTVGECPTDNDPCLSSVYEELDEPTRSTLYNFTTSNENDYTLAEEWYRSMSGAGGDMSTEVVNTAQCNALAPIYLTDRLPLESEGIVTAKACASFLDDTCIRKYYIPIKNCGDYNVYCLPPSADSHDRYCFGSELECDEGYTSENGFTPGCVPIEDTTHVTSENTGATESISSTSATEHSNGSNESGRSDRGISPFEITIIAVVILVVTLVVVAIVAVVCLLKHNRTAERVYVRPMSPPPPYSVFQASSTVNHPHSARSKERSRVEAQSYPTHQVRGSFGNNRVASATHGSNPVPERSMTPAL